MPETIRPPLDSTIILIISIIHSLNELTATEQKALIYLNGFYVILLTPEPKQDEKAAMMNDFRDNILPEYLRASDAENKLFVFRKKN